MTEAETRSPLALVVAGLTKRYGDVVALDGISLELPSGTIYGVTGPNGGGKSTLLRVLATIERPTEGSILIAGRDPFSQTRTVRRLVGYAGPPTGTPELTVAEEMAMAAQLGGVGRAEAEESIGAMLQIVDLYERRHRHVGELSRGERKRLAIARAMVHDPALLLFDGPFEGLDARARAELRAVLGELGALGKTLMIASGEPSELADLCPEIGVLEFGRLVASGPFESLSLEAVVP